jgi:GNAT superfamily N-acetyltransferase
MAGSPAGGSSKAAARAPAHVRRATAQDARFLAEMIDLSNAGGDRGDFERAIANVLAPGSDVGFGKAVIAEAGGAPAAAMVVNPPAAVLADLAAVESRHLPFEMLKAQAPGMLYLRNIAVHPEWEGRGLASLLAGIALEMARLGGMAGLCAIVHRQNHPMRALITAKGLEVAASGFLTSHPGYPCGIAIDLFTIRFA